MFFLHIINMQYFVVQDPTKRDALVDALDENGKDWEKVGLYLNAPPEVCQESFLELEKQSQKDENKLKKLILGTGTMFVIFL